MKLAILQVADTGPLESLIMMLESAGYTCKVPNTSLRKKLRSISCDTVLDIQNLVHNWGYETPDAVSWATPEDMLKADLYVDIKAHRNGSLVTKEWPNLEGKILWYRINGGEPEIVKGCGDEINPGCPILTPNLWYRSDDNAYACWPPFVKFNQYYSEHGRAIENLEPPICLIHNLKGWGYQDLISNMQDLDVRFHGLSSPNGLINHSKVPQALSEALCMIHLKSSDAPGYALYEGLAAACPLVVTRRLIWRNKMEDLLIPNETCLVFDQPTHGPLDVEECTREVKAIFKQLSKPEERIRIGGNGRLKLAELMWNKKDDSQSLIQFMESKFNESV